MFLTSKSTKNNIILLLSIFTWYIDKHVVHKLRISSLVEQSLKLQQPFQIISFMLSFENEDLYSTRQKNLLKTSHISALALDNKC